MGPSGTILSNILADCGAFMREDDANTTTEYTVMAAIIIVGLIAVLSPFSDRVTTLYDRIDAELSVTTESA